jgi:hypothetical protein
MFNFKNVEVEGKKEFKAVEQGIHVAKLDNIEEAEASNGTVYLKSTWSIGNQKVFTNFFENVYAKINWMNFASANGLDLDEIELSELVGKSAKIEIRHREYEGKTYAEISKIFDDVVEVEDDSEDDLDF